MKIFESVAQMKLAKLQAGQLTETKGYYTSGDSGAGRYLIAATQAVDGFGNHTLANGNVALLQASGAVNVLHYGATGDGVTDDTAAIQVAVTYAAANNLTLNFTGGDTYKITAAIAIVDSNRWKLVGNGCTIEQATTNTPCLSVELTDGGACFEIEIRGFIAQWTVQQTSTNTAANFITVNSAFTNSNGGFYNCLIDDFTVKNGHGGVILGDDCTIWGTRISNHRHLVCSGPALKLVPNYAGGAPNNSYTNVWINPDGVTHLLPIHVDGQRSFTYDNIELNNCVGKAMTISSSVGISGGTFRMEACTASSVALNALINLESSSGVKLGTIELLSVDFPVVTDYAFIVRVDDNPVPVVLIDHIITGSLTTSGGGFLYAIQSSFSKVIVGSINEAALGLVFNVNSNYPNVIALHHTGFMRTSSLAGIDVRAADAALVLTATSADIHYLDVPLTAGRAVTLPTGNANSNIRFTRAAASTGAFNWDIGGLKNLATSEWCEVVHTGTAWVLVSYGTL